ncbi:keratin, type II cytoskeletal, partial [Xylographa trunciseda]|nr:keratin, type II cytoskeletal [Xylographa trunciseda]
TLETSLYQSQAYSDILTRERALLLWQKAYAYAARPAKLRKLIIIWISLVKEKNQTLNDLSTTSRLQIEKLEGEKRQKSSKAQSQMSLLRKRIQALDTEQEIQGKAKKDDVDRMEKEKESLTEELNQLSLDYSNHRAKAKGTLKETKADLEEKLQAMTTKSIQAEAGLQAMTSLCEKEKANSSILEKNNAELTNQLRAVTIQYDNEQAKIQRSKSRQEDTAKQSTQRALQAMIKAIDPTSSYIITDTMTNDYLTIENSLAAPSSLAGLLPLTIDDVSVSPIKWYGTKPSSLVAHWTACYLEKLENEQAVTDLLSESPAQWQGTIPWVVSSCAVLLDGLGKTDPEAKAIAMGLYHLQALCLIARHNPQSSHLKDFCQGTVDQWQTSTYIQSSSLLSALYHGAKLQLEPGEKYFWTVAAVQTCREKLMEIEPDPAAKYRVLDPSNSDLTNLTLFLDAETNLFCAVLDIGQPTESVAIFEMHDIKIVSWGIKGAVKLSLNTGDSSFAMLEDLSLQSGFRDKQWVPRFVVCIEEKYHILV